jgi:hypothetical protein
VRFVGVVYLGGVCVCVGGGGGGGRGRTHPTDEFTAIRIWRTG